MPAHRLRRTVRITFVGMAVNAVLAGGKTVAGIVGHSQALIADGIESFADLFSSLVVWRGLVLAAAPADEQHPYGHGKAEPIAAAVVAAMLLFAAIAISIESVREIINPGVPPAPFTLAVLIAVVFIKEGLFRYVLRHAASFDSAAVRTDAWHHRSDAVTSLAAGVGIAIALIGGEGYEIADDIAALVAATIIAWNGWRLLRPALDELMDASASAAMIAEIRAIALDTPGVKGIEKCFARKMGYEYLVDMHVEVDPGITVQAGHDIAHLVKDRVRERISNVRDVLVHIEPERRTTAG